MEDERRADIDNEAQIESVPFSGWGKEKGIFLNGELVAVQTESDRLAVYVGDEGTFSDY